MSLSPAGSFASTASSGSSNGSLITFTSTSDDNSDRGQTSPPPGGSVSPRFGRFWSTSDLIIRTSDGIDFKTHKARLAGSSVFEDMFEIGSLSPESNTVTEEEAIPVISLSEDARTLELVLPFFYDEYPDVDSMGFEDVLKALEASLKYGMGLVEHIYTARLRRMLPTLPVNQAFILWARCSTLDKADLANEALLLTAKGDIMQFATHEIDLLDARSVDRLWRTHMKKQQKQNSLIFTYAWQQARGKCYYFQETSHKVYMETLIQAKCSNLKLAANDGVTREEPLGFRNCEKCSRMAEELGLFA